MSYSLLPLPPDLSLTPDTLLHAVSTVTDFWGEGGLLEWLFVPLSVQDRIRASPSYSSEDERRTAGLQYYLQTVPGASCGRIAGILWYLEEHTALESVRQYLPHQHGECIQSCGDGIFSLIFVDDAPNVLLHVCNIADIHVQAHVFGGCTFSLAGLT